MPRPAIHSYWQAEIKALAEADKASLSVDAIVASLRERKPPDSVSDPVPSARTVARYVREHRNADEKDRLPYRVFSWPQSMEAGSLPWEAARACLDLLRYRTDRGMAAPLVRECQAFWRITQAVPDAPEEKRVYFALIITLNEMLTDASPQVLTAIEWRLAYQPWRSEEDKEAFSALPEEWRKLPPVLTLANIASPAGFGLFGQRAPKQAWQKSQSTPKTKSRKGRK